MIDKYLTNYKITELGQVINKKTNRILKTYPRAGYPSVCLAFNNTKKTYSVHQIMAYYFLKTISTPYLVINHIDGNKTNNNLNNLEIISQRANVNKAFENNQRKIHVKPVIQYTKSLIKISEFKSIREAELMTNINNRLITAVCKGQKKSAYGYIWKYKNNDDEYKIIDLTEFIEIQNFPQYMISKYGCIYSKYIKKIMKLNICDYYSIKLCNNGYQKDFFVHRLVAESFIPNDDPLKCQVNHIDGDHFNNSVSNLEWITCSENIIHSHKFLRN